jgi:hypothetical protein
MNAKAEQLKKELDKQTKEITLKEPMDSKRMRLGLMDPPAGSWNQYFTNHFFADAEIRGLGMNLSTIDHCLRDDLFTMEQIRVMAGFMLPFSGEFLDYAGLRSVWGYIKRFLELLKECDNKKDLIGVCRSLLYYINYTHAWTHLYAPWGNGGAAYNFRSKEEIEDINKFYKSEKELKKEFPFDRSQNY